jgi:hypothetical protein
MRIDYKRNLRKWTALAIAIAAYFLFHEGAHLLYAAHIGAFKQINIIGFGIQIDVHAGRMSGTQFGIFNLLGPVATIACSYILLALAPKFVSLESAFARAIAYYATLAFLLIDPLYLSVLSLFVGGGDMNGIVLLFPETAVRVLAGVLAIANAMILFKILLPKYRYAHRTRS